MATTGYVPMEKQSKKARRQYYASRRADWNGVVPVTRVIPDKRRHNSESRNNRKEYEYDE